MSAAVFSTPAIFLMSLVNSAIYANCLHCLAVYGPDTWPKAKVRGLWSVKMENFRPSSMN